MYRELVELLGENVFRQLLQKLNRPHVFLLPLTRFQIAETSPNLTYCVRFAHSSGGTIPDFHGEHGTATSSATFFLLSVGLVRGAFFDVVQRPQVHLSYSVLFKVRDSCEDTVTADI